MVVQHITRRVDDLDGSEINGAEGPLSFAFDGASFEIDLTPQHVENLRDLLAPYMAAARRIGAAAKPSTKATQSQERRAIREWALANGFQVSERGRISDEVLRAYSSR
ncbi:Lsr2 family protein [Microbacterium sp. NPDC087589]|uniref:histone-like nucleoid-structuring protein Lsr2 n=1 Tax=Microbacterium sp. NPDC087589 TaxID=3364191 RepID=UPI00382CCD40